MVKLAIFNLAISALTLFAGGLAYKDTGSPTGLFIGLIVIAVTNLYSLVEVD